jgi:hypothetical protein
MTALSIARSSLTPAEQDKFIISKSTKQVASNLRLSSFLLEQYHDYCTFKIISFDNSEATNWAASVLKGLNDKKAAGVFKMSMQENLTFTDPMMGGFLAWPYNCIVNVIIAVDLQTDMVDPRPLIDFTLKLSSRDRSSNIFMVFNDGIVDDLSVDKFLWDRLRNFPSFCLMEYKTAEISCQNNLKTFADRKLGRGFYSVSTVVTPSGPSAAECNGICPV